MAIWNVGVKNGNWKGGRTITAHGYVLIRVGKEHPSADVRGYAYEHRLVAEQKLGRPLQKDEKVHHINNNKQDNAPANIEVMPSIAHHKVKHRKKGLHRRLPGQGNPATICRCGCGGIFALFDIYGRPRKYHVGHSRRKPK